MREVTMKEAATAAGVHYRTILAWCRSGFIQARQYPRSGPRCRWLVTIDRSGRPAVAGASA